MLPQEPENDEGQEDVFPLGPGRLAPAPEREATDVPMETPQGMGRTVEDRTEDGGALMERLPDVLEGPADGDGLTMTEGAARRALMARLREADRALEGAEAGAGQKAVQPPRNAGNGGEIPQPGRTEASAGLEELYRLTADAARPAPPALGTAGTAGRSVRAAEPEGGGGLTVDELDRAVRRDSRRYDGAMSIY